VPAEERQNIRLDDAALNSELLRMTDAYTDELFSQTPVEAGRVIFAISRLVCDVERFPSDQDEPMATRGRPGRVSAPRPAPPLLPGPAG
jgi:N-formylglutamate deformylase